MAHCVSSLSIAQPISSHKTLFNSNPNSRFLHSLITPISSTYWPKFTVKAREGEGRDTLDHLQRTNKQQSQQPRRRSAQVAPIGLWDRFPTARTVQQMMETMERMMEDPLAYSGGGWSSPLPPSDSGSYSRGRTPWEIKEGETEYKMRFDMPGMTREDVKVWVEEKMMVVKAEKVSEKKDENDEENGEEWSAKSYGRYISRIALPENVQFEKIQAEVKDGVLYITIPKASSSAKVFDINVE